MVNAILAYLEDQIRSVAVGTTLWLLTGCLFIFVMSRNFRGALGEAPRLTLDEDEQEIDRIHVRWPFLRTDTFLTSRRVIQSKLAWWLSKRGVKAISLDDVHSITWHRYTNWLLLLLAVYCLNTLNPAALLLLLFGLQSKVYTVRFGTPFAQMPYTRVVVTSTTRRQLAAMRAFYERSLDIWSRMIVEKRLATAVRSAVIVRTQRVSEGLVPGDIENDFAWGATLLSFIGAMMALAFAQRLFGPHVSFDDYLLGPVYIGLVAGVGGRSRRDGLWLALLGAFAVLTVKFPGSGILSFAADGRSPLFEEYVVVIGMLLLIALVAGWLARIHPMLAGAAVLLWTVVPRLTSTGSPLELSLITKVLLGAGWATLTILVDEFLRERFALTLERP